MKQWIKNITQVLHNPQYPQIQGALTRHDSVTHEIIGKCALGELNCAKKAGVIDICDGEGTIMKGFDVPKWLWHDEVLPELHYGYGVLKSVDELPPTGAYGKNLQNWIYGLNDAGLTYPQICEFLEVTFGS